MRTKVQVSVDSLLQKEGSGKCELTPQRSRGCTDRLVTSAFSVSSCFLLLHSALSSASEPSSRAWRSEELSTVGKDQG